MYVLKSWGLFIVKRSGRQVPALRLEKRVVLSHLRQNDSSDLREIRQVYFILMHINLGIWLEDIPFSLKPMSKVGPS